MGHRFISIECPVAFCYISPYLWINSWPTTIQRHIYIKSIIPRQSYMCIIRELFLWPHSHVRTIPIASIGSATSGAWVIAATMMWQMPCIMILWFSSRMRTRWRGICGSSGAPRWRRKWRRRCTATMTMMMRVVMRMMLGFHCIRVLSSDRDITIGINLLYYHLVLIRPAVYIVTRIIIWLFRECVLEKEELSN